MKSCPRCRMTIVPGTTKCRCDIWHTFDAKPSTLDKVTSNETKRILSGSWDDCFGGGITISTTTLVSGPPGAGKSTWVLHLSESIALKEEHTLYIASEEECSQIKARAERLQIKSQNLIYVTQCACIESLKDLLIRVRPVCVILDSLSGMIGSDLGHQGKNAVAVAKLLKRYCAQAQAFAIILNHVNKNDDPAGFRNLEHEVDCVISLNVQDGLIMMYTHKNRHGRSGIAKFFEMTDTGLKYFEKQETYNEHEKTA